MQQRRTEAISRIQTAASSPGASLEFYLQALDNTKYLDKHQEFLDWKQKNQDVIRHPSYQNATQLQLRYLLIALQRSEQHDAYAQVNETLGYLNSLLSLHFLEDPFVPPPPLKGNKPQPCPSDKVINEASEVMRQSLSSYPVVEWLQIKDLLPDKDFNGSAGEYFDILEKNVKVPLKQRKDPRLPGIWDLQISSAMAQSNSSADMQKSVVFKSRGLPELLFGKCTDLEEIGQPNRAVQELMGLIRAFPENPSVPLWIESTKRLITSRQVSPPKSTNSGLNSTCSTNTAVPDR